MEKFKAIWHITVLALFFSGVGGLVKATRELGISAANLHKKGMFSLAKFNRSLVGPSNLLEP